MEHPVSSKMEHPVWSQFREVITSLHASMILDHNLRIVKTNTGYDMVLFKNVGYKKILSLEEIMTNREALNYLVRWAVEEILPEE